MARERSDVLVRMPADLKRRLAEEVEARRSNLNDVAVGILASRYAVPFQGSGRHGGRPSGKGNVLLRMPGELKRKLAQRARERKRTTNQLIVESLAEAFDKSGKEQMASKNGSSNGRARSDERVRVAIIGVGNCANSLLQGVEYYKDADPEEFVPGLMHVDLGGYHVRDIEFSAAFDIDSEKVGKDLSEAIWSGQNDTIKFADVPKLGVEVHRGMTHDGLGKYLKQKIKKAPGPTADIVSILQETKTDVLVCYLPVGSEQATKWYVEQALKAGVGFVNCLPVFIAREDYWDKRFADAGLPIIGDDIKSQVGATIVHRQLARLFEDRGVRIERTSQLNVGGNMDFYNMLERERLESKKISKTNAVTSMLDYELPTDDVYIGPSDYVPWLTD